MPFVIHAKDKPGSAATRAERRPAHLDHLARHAAKLLAAGPLLADDGSSVIGSLIVLDMDDRAEVDAFIADDPYTQAGLFESVAVHGWRKVFLDGRRTA